MNIFERFDSFRRAMRKQNIRLRTVHDRPGCFIGERPSEKIPDEFETCLEIEGGLHGVRLKIYPDLEVCGLQMLEQALDLAKAALTDEYKLAAYRAAPETFRTAPVLRTFRDPRCLEEPFKSGDLFMELGFLFSDRELLTAALLVRFGIYTSYEEEVVPGEKDYDGSEIWRVNKQLCMELTDKTYDEFLSDFLSGFRCGNEKVAFPEKRGYDPFPRGKISEFADTHFLDYVFMKIADGTFEASLAERDRFLHTPMGKYNFSWELTNFSVPDSESFLYDKSYENRAAKNIYDRAEFIFAHYLIKKGLVKLDCELTEDNCVSVRSIPRREIDRLRKLSLKETRCAAFREIDGLAEKIADDDERNENKIKLTEQMRFFPHQDRACSKELFSGGSSDSADRILAAAAYYLYFDSYSKYRMELYGYNDNADSNDEFFEYGCTDAYPNDAAVDDELPGGLFGCAPANIREAATWLLNNGYVGIDTMFNDTGSGTECRIIYEKDALRALKDRSVQVERGNTGDIYIPVNDEMDRITEENREFYPVILAGYLDGGGTFGRSSSLGWYANPQADIWYELSQVYEPSEIPEEYDTNVFSEETPEQPESVSVQENITEETSEVTEEPEQTESEFIQEEDGEETSAEMSEEVGETEQTESGYIQENDGGEETSEEIAEPEQPESVSIPQDSNNNRETSGEMTDEEFYRWSSAEVDRFRSIDPKLDMTIQLARAIYRPEEYGGFFAMFVTFEPDALKRGKNTPEYIWTETLAKNLCLAGLTDDIYFELGTPAEFEKRAKIAKHRLYVLTELKGFAFDRRKSLWNALNSHNEPYAFLIVCTPEEQRLFSEEQSALGARFEKLALPIWKAGFYDIHKTFCETIGGARRLKNTEAFRRRLYDYLTEMYPYLSKQTDNIGGYLAGLAGQRGEIHLPDRCDMIFSDLFRELAPHLRRQIVEQDRYRISSGGNPVLWQDELRRYLHRWFDTTRNPIYDLGRQLADHLNTNNTIMLPERDVFGIEDYIDRQFGKMIGMDHIKNKILELQSYVNFLSFARSRDGGISNTLGNMHMVFTGSSGTGKTMTAKIISGLLYRIGIIPRDSLVVAERKDLVSEYIGQTAPKTAETVEKALGGVLFIDEAYSLVTESKNDFGKEAITALLTAMENHKNELVVIFAGYDLEMHRFLESNPGLRSRIGFFFHFNDYSPAELTEMFCRRLETNRMMISEAAAAKAGTVCEYFSHQRNFGNGRFVESLVMKTMIRHSKNLTDAGSNCDWETEWNMINEWDIPDISELTEQSSHSRENSLESLVGLEPVKEQIRTMEKRMKYLHDAKRQGLKPPAANQHMIFMGGAGTGKTMTARLIAERLYDIGVIQRDSCVVAGRRDLVSGYVGQTAQKTSEVIERSLGGVLFIDEAYSLIPRSENDFGGEVIETLLTAMEEHKENWVVIFAGYETEMTRFIGTNPGIASRIGYTMRFPDYDADALTEIFHRKLESGGYRINDDAAYKVYEVMQYFSSVKNFGNGRFVDTFIRMVLDRLGEEYSRNNAADMGLIRLEYIPDIPEVYAFMPASSSFIDPSLVRFEEMKRTAYHELGHAVMQRVLFPESHISRITIYPEGSGSLGYVMHSDNFGLSNTRGTYQKNIQVCVAGLAAEKLFLREFADGGGNDMKTACQLAAETVRIFGKPGQNVACQYSEEETRTEINRLVGEAFDEAQRVLMQYQASIEGAVVRLLEEKTIEAEELDWFLGREP